MCIHLTKISHYNKYSHSSCFSHSIMLLFNTKRINFHTALKRHCSPTLPRHITEVYCCFYIIQPMTKYLFDERNNYNLCTYNRQRKYKRKLEKFSYITQIQLFKSIYIQAYAQRVLLQYFGGFVPLSQLYLFSKKKKIMMKNK